MKVEMSERVRTTLNTLNNGDRERVRTWLNYLERWEEDPFAKNHSVELNVDGQTVYLFQTSTDDRIFYKMDQARQTVFVLEITNRDMILSFGSLAGGG